MNRLFLEQLFKDRRVADDPLKDGQCIQRFLTRIYKTYQEAEEEHAGELMKAFFLSVKRMDCGDGICQMAGLIFLTANSNNRIPIKWHIEYLVNRWFKMVSPYPTDGNKGAIITECRIVMDEWRETTTPTPTLLEQLKKLRDPGDPSFGIFNEKPQVITLADLRQEERQRIYETLHDQYGCRIY